MMKTCFQTSDHQLAARDSFPPTRPNLVLWLQASDPLSLVSPVPDPGNGTVARWLDKSGRGNHAVADGPGFPTLNTEQSGLHLPSGGYLRIANSPDINEGTPALLTHAVRFIPGSAADTRVVYEEGSVFTGLSIITSAGHVWSMMYSGAPSGTAPNFADLVDQGPLVPNRPVSISMTWSKTDARRVLYRDGVQTHSRPTGTNWPTHAGDIRLGVGNDNFLGSPPLVSPPVNGVSFDGTLLEIARWQV